VAGGVDILELGEVDHLIEVNGVVIEFYFSRILAPLGSLRWIDRANRVPTFWLEGYVISRTGPMSPAMCMLEVIGPVGPIL
jgi:hypothetical protein